MAAASSPPETAPSTPSTPARPSAPAARPREGDVRDVGTVRRDSVYAGRWTARGTVKVTGDVDVTAAQLEGTVSIAGKLTAGAFRSRGALEVEGPVDVRGMLDSSGGLHAASTVHAVEANLRGEVLAIGAVSVDGMLTSRGSLTAPSLSVGELTLEGEAQIPGDIVATTVTAHFKRDSVLWAVRARSVLLRAKIPNLVEKVLGRQMAVTIRRVEADTVDLEGVDVKFVRSPKITLGRDAHVTEYEGTIVRRHPSSRVGFESRSRRPYGLWR
ncbi:MAG: hypothetical protein ACLP8Y_02455 [Thermoplasmata archaeon]